MNNILKSMLTVVTFALLYGMRPPSLKAACTPFTNSVGAPLYPLNLSNVHPATSISDAKAQFRERTKAGILRNASYPLNPATDQCDWTIAVLARLAFPDYFGTTNFVYQGITLNGVDLRQAALDSLMGLNRDPDVWKMGTTIDDLTPIENIFLQDNRKGEYDVTMTALTTVLYKYGPRGDNILPPAVYDHVLSQIDMTTPDVQEIKLGFDPLTTCPPLCLVYPPACIGCAFLSTLEATLPETENHLNNIYVARYLANQLWFEKTHDSQYDNASNGRTSFMLNRLAGYVRNDFIEYNAHPYQDYAMQALLNLYSYADDPNVKLAAQMVLDYISAKVAVSSDDARRSTPFRRLNQPEHTDPELITGGADPQTSWYMMLAGVTDMAGDPNNAGTHFGFSSGSFLHAGLSDYRIPDLILDLFVNRDHRNFYQYFHYCPGGCANCASDCNDELYFSSPSYLICAGGHTTDYAYTVDVPFPVSLIKDHIGRDADLGVAFPTLLMPTRQFTSRLQMIRFSEGDPDGVSAGDAGGEGGGSVVIGSSTVVMTGAASSAHPILLAAALCPCGGIDFDCVHLSSIVEGVSFTVTAYCSDGSHLGQTVLFNWKIPGGRDMGVAPNFACGLHPRIPDNYTSLFPTNCQFEGAWTFIDQGHGPGQFGYYLAVHTNAAFGFLEAYDTFFSGSMSFPDFKAKVLANNNNRTFVIDQVNTYMTVEGTVIQFRADAEIVSINGVPPYGSGGINGDIINSDGQGRITIDNPSLRQRLTLDVRDPQHPIRTQEPVITCPADVTVGNDPGKCSAVVNFVVTGGDSPGLTVVCVPPSGSVFPKGTTTVNCTATDPAGNVASCSFKVTVNDTEPPKITCPDDIVAITDTGKCTAAVSFAPVVTDNCPGVSVVCIPPSGSDFPIGTTTVNCTATDTSGNNSSCSFSVTVSTCGTNPPVVVTQNVSVDFNTSPPAYNGDPVLQPYVFADTSGPTPDTWKLIIDMDRRKLIVSSGVTITTVPVPARGNNRRAPGIEIHTCELEVQKGAVIEVNSINKQAGDIVLDVLGDIIIDGTVINSVTGTQGRPGAIRVNSLCQSFSTGPDSRLTTYGQDDGGSDINIATCGAGDVSIKGLVDASYKARLASTIRISAFDGSVNIDGTHSFGTEVVAGTLRTITSGVSVRSRRDPLPGTIAIQASDNVNVQGSTLQSKKYPNYGAVAVKTMSNSSKGGLIDVRALNGNIAAIDRAFDDENRFNDSAVLSLQAGNSIGLTVSGSVNDGAKDNTKAVVSTQAGDTGKGGTNFLRAFNGGISLGLHAQVLANYAGRPGANGANRFTSCTGVFNSGTVAPPAQVNGGCGNAPDPLFLDCGELGF